MFNKRLLQEFTSLMPKVRQMVLIKWFALLANLVIIYGISKGLITLFEKGTNPAWYLQLLILFLLAVVVRSFAHHVQGMVSVHTSEQVKEHLRIRIFDKLSRLGKHYQKEISTSEVVQISTEGTEQLEIYFGKYMPQFFYSLLAPLTLFVVVSFFSIKIGFILFICVPLIPISIVAVQKIAKRILNKYWGAYIGLGDTFLESLQGLTTLKIFEQDQAYEEKMGKEAENFRKITMRVLIMQLNSISIMDLVAYGGAALGILFVVLETNAQRLDLFQAFFIIAVSAEFFLPMRLLGSFFHIAMNGNAAAKKIFRFLDLEEEFTSNGVQKEFDYIDFKQTCFTYDGEKEVVSNFTLKLSKGLTAVVGESGCGKSTLSSLLQGDLKPTEGSIFYGETPQQDINPMFLKEKITKIKHNSYLFSGTVAENLRFGKADASDGELMEVLKRVHMEEVVLEKGGLTAIVAENATNFSGGQSQRLAIARALLHDSPVYIFDEATSNVDVESENEIMNIIYQLGHEKMVLLISHRLANVIEANQIVVMKNGELLALGTHKELLDTCEYYRNLYETQKKLEQYTKEVAS